MDVSRGSGLAKHTSCICRSGDGGKVPASRLGASRSLGNDQATRSRSPIAAMSRLTDRCWPAPRPACAWPRPGRALAPARRAGQPVTRSMSDAVREVVPDLPRGRPEKLRDRYLVCRRKAETREGGRVAASPRNWREESSAAEAIRWLSGSIPERTCPAEHWLKHADLSVSATPEGTLCQWRERSEIDALLEAGWLPHDSAIRCRDLLEKRRRGGAGARGGITAGAWRVLDRPRSVGVGLAGESS